jgi:hypothetical protein
LSSKSNRYLIDKLCILPFLNTSYISWQILRRVHIVTYKISHQFYMVTTIAKPYTDYK